MKNKNNLKQSRFLLLTTLMATSFVASAAATGHEANQLLTGERGQLQVQQKSPFLQDLVVRSELIFRGELVDISERLSIEQIPYTFVTYAVKEVIAGRYVNNTITLKYVGGQFPNGNRLSASNSPAVKVGEDAILMVQQAVDTGCDFVDCENGRFLIENDRVIAANESSITLDDDGSVGYTGLSERHKSGALKSTVSTFIAHLKSLDNSALVSKKKSSVVVFDIDKQMPFKAYPVLTQAGQAPEVPQEQEKDLLNKNPRKLSGSQFDQWEVSQLELNGGDPLLNPADAQIER